MQKFSWCAKCAKTDVISHGLWQTTTLDWSTHHNVDVLVYSRQPWIFNSNALERHQFFHEMQGKNWWNRLNLSFHETCVHFWIDRSTSSKFLYAFVNAVLFNPWGHCWYPWPERFPVEIILMQAMVFDCKLRTWWL